MGTWPEWSLTKVGGTGRRFGAITDGMEKTETCFLFGLDLLPSSCGTGVWPAAFIAAASSADKGQVRRS